MNTLTVRVLIVEDETPAAEKLERYLTRYSSTIKVMGVLGSVKEAIHWLEEKQQDIELIFMDIQLKDGVSFDIFKKVSIQKPVIFITAYNDFALEAFAVHGIAYLLKPITYADLSESLQKLEALSEQLRWNEKKAEKIITTFAYLPERAYKNRFMVKLGDHIRSITAEQISLFFAEGRDVYLVTDQVRKFIVDFTMENIEEVLDPKHFFRVNRSYILHMNAIQDVVVYSSSRLKITPHIKWPSEIIVSREKVNHFKEWFDGVH
jgi:two-component system LytT family response regulator